MSSVPTLPSLVRTSPTFRADIDAYFSTRLPATVTGFNIVADEVNANALTASSAATTATTKAAQTLSDVITTANDRVATAASAAASAASALTATNAPGTNGTSTTSLTLSAGTKVLTTQTGKAWVVGQPVNISRTSAPATAFMYSLITAYDIGTGSMSVSVPLAADVTGSGTFSDWTIALVGPKGIAALGGVATSTIDLVTGTPIASASTINLDTATGNRIRITGTTPISNVTLTRGPRLVIFTTVLQLNYNAVTNQITGGVNITTAPGDICEYHSDGTAVYGVYTKADGTAVTGALQLLGAPGTAQVIEALGMNLQPFLSICTLSAMRAMVIYGGPVGPIRAAVLDNTGTPLYSITLESAPAVSTPQIIALNSTTALAVYATNVACRVVVLTDTGSAITFGAAANPVATTANSVCLIGLSAIKAIVVVASSAGTQAWTATVTGSAVALGVSVTVAVNYIQYVRGAATSSTQIVLLGSASGSPNLNIHVITEASAALTLNTSVAITGPSANNQADIALISATRLGVVWGGATASLATNVAFTIDVFGTGSTATVQSSKLTPLAMASTIPPRLARLSNNTLLMTATTQNLGATLQNLSIRGSSLEPGSGANITRSTLINDICVLSPTTALAVFNDANNGNFPTARPMALGSVI